MKNLTVKLAISHVTVLLVGVLLGAWIVTGQTHEEGGSVGHEYVSLLKDPAHFLYEMTLNIGVDILIIGLLIPVVARAIKRHDAEHHQGHVSESADPGHWRDW